MAEAAAPDGDAAWSGPFAQALLDPSAAVPDGLRDPAGAAAGRRFSIYRNNVVVGLTEALAANFPVLERLLGADDFRGMAGDFVRRHPPRSRILHEYGDLLPAFLAAAPQLRALPYLADVARLERARLVAYHAADAAPLDGAALGGLSPDALAGLRLAPHPAAQLLRSPYAIVAIWEANRPGRAPQPVDGAQPQVALVTRPVETVELYALADDTAAFIEALMRGETLAEAAGDAASRSADFDLAAAIRLAVGSGAFRAGPL